jgi:hypothetical protein
MDGGDDAASAGPPSPATAAFVAGPLDIDCSDAIWLHTPAQDIEEST